MNRFHIHVNVDDLTQSINFYSSLFGTEPTVTKDDYAKWLLDDPTVNFAISVKQGAKPGLNHVGLQTGDGPSGLRWETFYTHGDATEYGVDASETIYIAIETPKAKSAASCC